MAIEVDSVVELVDAVSDDVVVSMLVECDDTSVDEADDVEGLVEDVLVGDAGVDELARDGLVSVVVLAPDPLEVHDALELAEVVRPVEAEVVLAPVLDDAPVPTEGDSPPHAPRSTTTAAAPMPLPCRTTMRSSVTVRVLHPLHPTALGYCRERSKVFKHVLDGRIGQTNSETFCDLSEVHDLAR